MTQQNTPSTSQTGQTPQPSPPPYAEPSVPNPRLFPRVNNLYLVKHHASINGTWTVDPTLKVPQPLLPPLPDGEKNLDNLHLATHHGSITAQLNLESEKPTKSNLEAQCAYGSVTVNIMNRVNQRFRLKVRDDHGRMVVYIPRDFEGPVSWVNSWGDTTFSDAVASRMSSNRSEIDGAGKAFIGDLTQSGFGQKTASENTVEGSAGSWHGDELHLENRYGRIKVFFADEPPEEGLLSRMTRAFTNWVHTTPTAEAEQWALASQ
ncbi:hypothetical protein FS837_009590 [Tulasnella sp. UAMH 9824]|nr:hypothetical protein FS837_009590 [Tulasnella sp. UAMH 9824]